MYKVLIIDDEPLITQGVRSKINRMDHPLISQVDEQNNPVEALSFIKDNRPDIVITDMKMPDMNGIELVKATRGYDDTIKFIILSGYDDYKYVRESFQQGAIDYLLKPVSLEDLTIKLNDAIRQIESERESRTIGNEQLSQAISKLTSKASDGEIDEALLQIKENLGHTYMQLAAISLPSDQQMTRLSLMTKELLRLFDERIVVYNYYDQFKNSVLIFNFNEKDDQLEVARMLTTYLKKQKESTAPATRIALTSAIGDIHQLKDIHNQLREILSAKILYAPYSLMIHDETEKSDTMDANMVKELTASFMRKDYSSINSFIDHYFVQKPIDYQTLHEPQKVYQIIQQKINELFHSSDLTQVDLFNRRFDAFDSLTALRLYLKDCLFKVQAQLEKKDSDTNTIIEMAVAYINEHLDEDINMASISNHLSLNYSYFSKLFKETMKISFKKYLIQVRMELAKELLNDPTNKIYEVAAKTGYDNAQNFSRAFKSHFGFSPKDYRTK